MNDSIVKPGLRVRAYSNPAVKPDHIEGAVLAIASDGRILIAPTVKRVDGIYATRPAAPVLLPADGAVLLSGYVAIYKGERIEVWALSLYEAKCIASEIFGGALRKNKANRDKAYNGMAIALAVKADGADYINPTDF